MTMGDAGVTALVMIGEVCGRWRRGSRSYSYVDLYRKGFLRAFPPERLSWIPGKTEAQTKSKYPQARLQANRGSQPFSPLIFLHSSDPYQFKIQTTPVSKHTLTPYIPCYYIHESYHQQGQITIDLCMCRWSVTGCSILDYHFI